MSGLVVFFLILATVPPPFPASSYAFAEIVDSINQAKF